MDLLKLGAELFLRNIGAAGGQGLSPSAVTAALGRLLGGDHGKIDLADLLTQLRGAGLQEMVGSWLGTGANARISPEQLSGVLGESRIGGFAASLGLDRDVAANGLAESLPTLIDKASPAGSLTNGGLLGNVLGGLLGR